MTSSFDDIFVNSYPKLDLHGEIRSSAKVLVNEFINDNYILRNYKVLIVHGKGTGALKEEVFKVLKENKLVLSYHLNHYNDGCTVVYIKNRKEIWDFDMNPVSWT